MRRFAMSATTRPMPSRPWPARTCPPNPNGKSPPAPASSTTPSAPAGHGRPAPNRLSRLPRDVIDGLTARPKRLSPKYFYDETGSRLFEEITALPEYYPTRCELEILRTHAADMARLLPPKTALIEFGSGSSKKARLLLDAAPAIAAYVPVDISSTWLTHEAAP